MRFVERWEYPIWTSLKFVGESGAGMGKDNLGVEYKIYKNKKQIELEYTLNKKQVLTPESLYVTFPFELENSKIHFDVAGAFVEAGVDQIVGSSNDWNTVQNFASVGNSEARIVLVSPEAPLMQFGNINSGRFKAGAKPDSSNIFSWVLNNYWITNFNADQQGQLKWRYFITSSDNPSLEYAAKFAHGLRVPMLSRLMPPQVKKPALGEESDRAKLSKYRIADGQIFKLRPDNLLLVSMTPCEGENALILQLREIANRPAKLEIESDLIAGFDLRVCNAIGEILDSDLNFAPLESKFIKLGLPK